MNKIVLQFVQFIASAQFESYVREKVARLFIQDSSIIRADVTLFKGASGNPRDQFCEIQISIVGENLFVKKNSESYEKSILDAVKSLQKVLRRQKSKSITKRRF